MTTISATELARNTRAILDQVSSRGETVTIERNRNLVARIVPLERTMSAAQVLAELKPMLTAKQAAAWLEESRAAFDEALRDPWA